jgi:hypothetical protein
MPELMGYKEKGSPTTDQPERPQSAIARWHEHRQYLQDGNMNSQTSRKTQKYAYQELVMSAIPAKGPGNTQCNSSVETVNQVVCKKMESAEFSMMLTTCWEKNMANIARLPDPYRPTCKSRNHDDPLSLQGQADGTAT